MRDLLSRVRDRIDGEPSAGKGRDAGDARGQRGLADQCAVAPRARPLRRVDDEVAAAGPDRVDDRVALLEPRHVESDGFEHGSGTGGAAFLSVRELDKAAIPAVAQALVKLGFDLLATAGTAAVLEEIGLDVTTLEKGGAVVDAIRAGRCDLVVNTPQGSGARRDGGLIRQAALSARVPCITTLSGARLAVDAIANAREEIAHSLQERIEQETRAA